MPIHLKQIYSRDDGKILPLADSQFEILLRDGRVVWARSPRPARGAWALALPARVAGLFFEDDPARDLRALRECARVVRRDEGGAPVYSLESAGSLGALLERAAATLEPPPAAGQGRAPQWLARRESVDPRAVDYVAPPRSNVAVIAAEELRGWLRLTFGEEPTPAAIEALRARQPYAGMLSCCTCEIAGCGSTYLWSVDGLALCVARISAASLAAVHPLPFALASGSTEPR